MRLLSTAQWKAVTAWLSMTSNIAVILSLFLLDLRDLYYKVAWIGPTESYSFRTGSTSVLQLEPLRVSAARDLRLLHSNSSSASTIMAMDSGWPSFLARCEQLHAMGADGSTFFLSAMGTNCTLGASTSSAVVAQLILTSDQRVDALVWASCLLLHVSQRPRICYEPIASDFSRRYMFKPSDLPASVAPVEINSAAEHELLRFLDMVSDSFPLHRVICVEAFAVDPDPDSTASVSRKYTPTVFGCGSPSAFRSEFVGMLNPRIVALLATKAWLTADAISIMGTKFLIRQNCYGFYTVRKPGDGNALVLQSVTTVNFSSFGQLFLLLILIDLALLTLNCRSSVELVQWMSFPKYADVKTWVEQKEAAHQESQARLAKPHTTTTVVVPARRKFFELRNLSLSRRVDNGSSTLSTVAPFRSETNSPSLHALHHPQPSSSPDPSSPRIQHRRRLLATMEAMSGSTAIEDEQLSSFFSRSLYRNPRIVLLTLTTQLMSWLVVLPNAVVWTWSDSTYEKLQAYLSSIRCWVLILILCNTLWSGVVSVSERAAYNITKRTFLTSVDIVWLGSLVSFTQRHYIFAMSEAKWALEHQRVNDVTSFDGGFLAHGNTFDVALDSVDTTPLEVVAILYAPLARILLTSLAAIVVLLSLKAIYFSRRRKLIVRSLARRLSRLSRRLSRISSSSTSVGGDVQPTATMTTTTTTAMATTTTHRHATRNQVSRDDEDDDEDDEDERMEEEKALEQALSVPYQRLPLEEWLDRPIRATSLIRNGLRMETIRDNARLIRPSCYLDFGIIVKRGVIHSRIGFSDTWKPKMSVAEYLTRVEHQTPSVHVASTAATVGATVVTLERQGSRLSVGNTARVTSSQRLIPPMERKRSLHVPLS